MTLAVALICSATALAEGNGFGAGINVGMTPDLESGVSCTNFTLGGKVFYDISKVRAGVDFDYGFKNKGLSVWDLMATFQYRFNVSSKLVLYPTVGLGFAHLKAHGVSGSFGDYGDWGDWNKQYQDAINELKKLGYDMNDIYKELGYDKDDFDYSSDGDSSNKFAFQVGFGGEYMITDNFGINLEAKYQYIKDFNRLPVSIGFTYKF